MEIIAKANTMIITIIAVMKFLQGWNLQVYIIPCLSKVILLPVYVHTS